MDTRDAVLRRIELAERQDARTHGQFFEDTLTALRELYGAELAKQARGAVTGWSGTGSFSVSPGSCLDARGGSGHLASRLLDGRAGTPESHGMAHLFASRPSFFWGTRCHGPAVLS